MRTCKKFMHTKKGKDGEIIVLIIYQIVSGRAFSICYNFLYFILTIDYCMAERGMNGGE